MGRFMVTLCDKSQVDFKIHIGKKKVTETKLGAIEANILFFCASQVPLVAQ